MEETELLGREIDFEGFEIELLAKLVQEEVTRLQVAGSDQDELDDMENILDKLVNP